ncbi:uncharacterized protein LY89DRAFT_355328 [Mollisia scopiformis]|uniref:Uncharacterized protein n=1 Tax=Mollisia scopiformis TaxID=149040 RepID=A0A132B514_MOLSC|nr:uncharacterized protein LY89DRAFT_355328 [Mollisia scopiformis]KUJ07495.1 hypothetical protein LY89DRAFT_355328 [Mollisia scopiformis]
MADHPSENLIPEPSNTFPNLKASPREVRQWIQGWFKQQGHSLTVYDARIKNVHWNGSELHRISYHSMVHDLIGFGYNGYAGDLAHEIFKARTAEEEGTEFVTRMIITVAITILVVVFGFGWLMRGEVTCQ